MSGVERVEVCSERDLQPGATRKVTVSGRPVVCVNAGGELFAVSGRCPHQGADLSWGTVSGVMAESRPQTYVYDCGERVLRCPWHGWQFDLRTGQSLFDERTGIRRYEVEVVNGMVNLLVPA